MYHRIHIFGASGSGATTLGQELSRQLPHVLMDGDDYFWIEKYTRPREPKKRLELLKEDLSRSPQWILTGAVCGWGDELRSAFDLIVFLYVPEDVRLMRLRKREYERYGDKILPGGSMHAQSVEFLEWASRYDTAGSEIRSRVLHEEWMAHAACPILRIEGEHTVHERAEIILGALHS